MKIKNKNFAFRKTSKCKNINSILLLRNQWKFSQNKTWKKCNIYGIDIKSHTIYRGLYGDAFAL